MTRIVLLLIALISLVSVAAVACGEDDESDTLPDIAALSQTVVPATDTSQSAAASQQQTEATPTPAATGSQQPSPAQAPVATKVEEPQEMEERTGGVLRRLWSDPPTLDPHLSGDTTSAGVVVEIFSGLVALNTDLQLVPDVADRWEISQDGKTYTFYIRDNARFHDGKPITASDFKWSLERAASPDTASPVADTYLSDIVGVDDVLEGRTTDIAGVRVIDDRTLQIEIDAPKAYFLAKMTYPTAYVLDRENVEAGGNSWTDSPNGSGPFRLAEYTVGEVIVLERNENFYLEPPHLDSVIMNLAGGQSMAMYENDEIDITGVGLFELDRVLDPTEPLNKELVIAPPSFTTFYIGFNVSEPPFDDPKFRQALTHAVDKDLIANEVLSTLVTPAYGVLPPGFPGYNADLEGLQFDPDLARQLLSESDYADAETRPRIVVTVPGTGGSIGLDMEVVIEMWRQELEVEVEIQQVEWATYLQDLNANKFQAFGGSGWQADYPDPQDFLDILFHTDSKQNHTSYSNPELDSILEQARTEPDVERRVELYHQAEDLIVQDAPLLPLWYTGEQYVLIKGHIEDYRLTPMTIPKLRHVKFSG
ncbi:MAG: peptide ABC transporter substrate-binding protein [Dehalococcoidia bacterium]|nr:peptide ABC transporter substrate-binding protein [Dehalococcoidia bacterium]